MMLPPGNRASKRILNAEAAEAETRRTQSYLEVMFRISLCGLGTFSLRSPR
jgi:hypothetical protein